MTRAQLDALLAAAKSRSLQTKAAQDTSVTWDKGIPRYAFTPYARKSVPIAPAERDWSWYTNANNRRIGGTRGTFYRNTDPGVPLNEYFVRPYRSGLGVVNIPRNPNITPTDSARIGAHIVREHGRDGKALGMTAEEIARGIDGHVLGDNVASVVGNVPGLEALKRKVQSYDINYPLDPEERMAGRAADVVNRGSDVVRKGLGLARRLAGAAGQGLATLSNAVTSTRGVTTPFALAR